MHVREGTGRDGSGRVGTGLSGIGIRDGNTGINCKSDQLVMWMSSILDLVIVFAIVHSQMVTISATASPVSTGIFERKHP